jgi:hypothetical protein
MLAIDETPLTWVIVIVDCHLEPIYNYLENSMLPFVDDLTFVGVGMDNPLAFFAALDHH